MPRAPRKPGRTAAGRDRARAQRAAKKAREKAQSKAQGKAGGAKKPSAPAAAKAKGKTRAKRARPGGLKSKLKAPKLSAPKLPEDALFRASTRLKAVGYGAREVAWKGSRGFEKRVERPVRGFWKRRSGRTRLIVAAVAVLILAVSFLRYTPFPGVPCGASAVKECPPEDNLIGMVPADALIYSHLTLDTGTPQFERLDAIVDAFNPVLSDQLGTALLPEPSGQAISFGKDIRPWASNDAAVVVTPGTGGSRAFVFGVRDRKGADAFLAKIAPAPGRTEKAGDAELTIREGSLTSAYRDLDGEKLIVGGEAAVRAVLTAGTNGTKTLGDEANADEIRGELPENRFADLYVSEAGIQELFVPSTTTLATQLETFVDYGASRGFAMAAVANEGEVQLDVYSALDPAKQKSSPSLFTTLPHFVPALTGDVGARALGYVGIGEAGTTLGALLKRAGSVSPGVASSLEALQASLGSEGKEGSAATLLPALGGQAALVAEPTEGIPFASLIVDDVNEDEARAALAALQAPLVRSLQRPDRPLPGFREVSLKGGIRASQLEVSPQVNLTYAVFDRKLVVSTQPDGVEQVAQGGGARLDGAADFTEAIEGLPRELSMLVFVDLHEVLGLAEDLGQAEDPVYALFREDIRKLRTIAVGVDAGEHDLSSRMTIAVG